MSTPASSPAISCSARARSSNSPSARTTMFMNGASSPKRCPSAPRRRTRHYQPRGAQSAAVIGCAFLSLPILNFDRACWAHPTRSLASRVSNDSKAGDRLREFPSVLSPSPRERQLVSFAARALTPKALPLRDVIGDHQPERAPSPILAWPSPISGALNTPLQPVFAAMNTSRREVKRCEIEPSSGSFPQS